MESIKYWQKQLRAGNYKKLDESIDVRFSKHEKDLLDYYFTELFTEESEMPNEYQIETFKFKDDPNVFPSYEDYFEKYGSPSLIWVAAEYADFAMDGRNIKELAAALKKLQSLGYISFDPKTGIMKIDTDHI